MKKIYLIVFAAVTLLATGCGDKAPKPSLSGNGVEEIRVEEIRVEEIRTNEITWENNVTRWD